MKKLFYCIEYFSHVYNEQTGETERIPSLSKVAVENPTDEDIARAQACAWNGEYSIEDDGQSEQEEISVWDELDAAYQEGVDSA